MTEEPEEKPGGQRSQQTARTDSADATWARAGRPRSPSWAQPQLHPGPLSRSDASRGRARSLSTSVICWGSGSAGTSAQASAQAACAQGGHATSQPA